MPLDRYNPGVRWSKVNINDVQPPEQVLAAFDDAVQASQDRESCATKARPRQ